MKFLNKNKALCLCPHPDDTALSMSHVVQKYKDTEFHMLYLSAGTMTDETTGPARFAEDIQFWKSLEVDNVQLHFVDGCAFDSTPTSTWITRIEKQFLNGVDVIFSTGGIDSHYEHKITNSFLYPLSRSKPLTLVEYRSVSTLREWVPNLFVHMSDDELMTKIKHLRNAFVSQVDSPYFNVDELINFHEDFINKKRSCNYSEMFKVIQHYEGIL